MKILNAFSGLGICRKYWQGDITAIECIPEIAAEYERHYPDDRVIVADAYEFIEKNYSDYEVIWASPPCTTHTRNRWYREKMLPDLRLYSLVIFLKSFYKGNWLVENVIPYYDPLINAQDIDRHLIWSNIKFSRITIKKQQMEFITKQSDLEAYLQYEMSDEFRKQYNGRKDKVMRNGVHPEIGRRLMDQLQRPGKTLLDFCSSN